MNEFALIAGMAVATMATRIPVLVWLTRHQLPPALFRALKYVPPAVLAAIIAPAVLMPRGELALNLNAELAASVLAILVSWHTRSLLLTILLGMGAFLLLKVFL
jgi:branched-subunit amino acid transport protein